MKLVLTLCLLFVLVATACSSAFSSEPMDNPDEGATPTATPTVAPTPPGAPSAVIISETPSGDLVVQVEFPTWVEESPKMAQHIGASDVIVKAKLVSLESTTKRHESYGYVAELIYKFEIVQYLKGNGPDELVVNMDSGPKYIAFPDWLDHRTESEAIELAEDWLNRNRAMINRERDGDAILLLGWLGHAKGHYFTSVNIGRGRGGHPIIGESWLPKVKPSTYRHRFNDGNSTTISLSDFNGRIEDMRPLWKGTMLHASL